MTHRSEPEVQDESLPVTDAQVVNVEEHVAADVREDDGVVGEHLLQVSASVTGVRGEAAETRASGRRRRVPAIDLFGEAPRRPRRPDGAVLVDARGRRSPLECSRVAEERHGDRRVLPIRFGSMSSSMSSRLARTFGFQFKVVVSFERRP